jgi:hypothetical protein
MRADEDHLVSARHRAAGPEDAEARFVAENAMRDRVNAEARERIGLYSQARQLTVQAGPRAWLMGSTTLCSGAV